MSTQYQVACPKCGAVPYRVCRSLTKGLPTDTHAARLKADAERFLKVRRPADD